MNQGVVEGGVSKNLKKFERISYVILIIIYATNFHFIDFMQQTQMEGKTLRMMYCRHVQ